MNDWWKILTGLVIFLILITFPIWYNMANGKAAYRPDPQILTEDVPGKDQCVMPADYMRAKHMDLLDEWRDKVVREDDRIHVAPSGKRFERSLSNTCLDCHENKDTFCDRCHNYMDVSPYCWECHIVPKEVKPWQ